MTALALKVMILTIGLAAAVSVELMLRVFEVNPQCAMDGGRRTVPAAAVRTLYVRLSS
jgi:hypothetical protein